MDYFVKSDSVGTISLFKRRKPIKLTHSGTLTDYQYFETFDYEPAMLNNFDDIRFVTQSGEHIPYWIETKTDGVSAKVWFMNDYVDGDTYIWMYYGSDGLSSGSSIDDTMIFGDKFDGSSLDTAKWDIIAGTPTINDGLSLDGGETIESKTDFSASSIFEAKGVQPNETGSTVYAVFGMFTPGDGATFNAYFNWDGYSEDVGNTRTTMDSWAGSHRFTLKHISGNSAEFLVDDVSKLTISTNVTSANIPVYFKKAGVNDLTFEWVFIRQYTAVEPTVTVGAEQHPKKGDIMIL